MGIAFSGEIGTPAAFSGDNRTPHGLSGKIGTLRGSKLAKCRPKTPQMSKCCPRTHRMSKCCPTTTQRPRIARQRHRHRSRAISRGAVAQTFMPVLGTSFSRIGKHLGINAANPRIARGHHALTGTRPNRYSHYWNERISGVGGARGLPPPPIDILELIRRKRERDREALTLHRIGQDPNAHLVAQPFYQVKTYSR